MDSKLVMDGRRRGLERIEAHFGGPADRLEPGVEPEGPQPAGAGGGAASAAAGAEWIFILPAVIFPARWEGLKQPEGEVRGAMLCVCGKTR